ncbi:MAG TPA: acyl-CoA dehydrogenase family protein, partial [Roseiarcus sp.]|nr:acyl-CoA dehydrogenase family protein [Roseiarcus sp.]
MELRFTDEELAFRDEVRAFLATSLPDPIRRKLVAERHIGKDDLVAWTRILNKKGWAVAHWPPEWGGTGWSAMKQLIFRDEMQQAPAPEPLAFGVNMVGPV